MKKVFPLIITAILLFIGITLAQNSSDTNRILDINTTYDTAWGVNIVNPLNGVVTYHPDLKVTVGKTALWECIYWGRAVTGWWAWMWGYGDSDARINAKNCARNVLAPVYADRKIALQAAMTTAFNGNFAIGNFFNTSGFIRSQTILMEYETLATLIDADYEAVRTSGRSWGQLPQVPPVARPQSNSSNSPIITLP